MHSKPIARLRLRLALVAFALVAAQAGTAFAKKRGPQLIGYVNLQRAILEVEEGKRAKSALKSTFDVKKKKLEAKETKLIKLRDEIRKEASVKSDQALRERAFEFEKQRMELQEVFMREQKALQELEQDRLGEITKKMRGVIEAIGKGSGYSLILELQDSRLLYAKQHLDLTNEVIRKYNQKFP